MRRISNSCMRALAADFAISIVLFSTIATLGCRPVKTPEQDPNAYVAMELANWHNWRVQDKAAEQRVQLALSKWQNRVLDREPILLAALLVKVHGPGQRTDIALFAYDEDKDLLGLRVIEKHRDGTERAEEYPVYVNAGPSRVVDNRPIPVHVRDKGQQKDESLWEEYVRGDKIDKEAMRHTGGKYYLETLPPVYVSPPDPNKVDVLVYVYDRRGNKSPPVELINRLNVYDPENDKAHPVGIRRINPRSATRRDDRAPAGPVTVR